VVQTQNLDCAALRTLQTFFATFAVKSFSPRSSLRIREGRKVKPVQLNLHSHLDEASSMIHPSKQRKMKSYNCCMEFTRG
jgi:hypothetical protein